MTTESSVAHMTVGLNPAGTTAPVEVTHPWAGFGEGDSSTDGIEVAIAIAKRTSF